MADKEQQLNNSKIIVLRKILKGIYIFFGLLFLFLVVLVCVLLIIYLVKSFLGIDFFSDRHLGDWF